MGQTSMDACRLVFERLSRFQWREVTLIRDGQREPIRVSLSKSDWQKIPFEQLPKSTRAGSPGLHRVLNIGTDVGAFSNVQYAKVTGATFRYSGNPLRQTWLFHQDWIDQSATDSEIRPTVEIMTTDEFPFNSGSIPGGTVIDAVRVTIPMPCEKPVWLEIRSTSPDHL